ncbi:MAG TPA: type II secretion system protein [Pirellulales bacterium]|nr:type II secretion system protein [Pirellulales bacterium]
MSDFRFLPAKMHESKADRAVLVADRRRSSAARGAFTLIELLVAISIIGILAALALGGMYRANLSAKQLNSKTTVNKVAVQINEIWESYRSRKLPIDPKLILQPSSSSSSSPYYLQWCAATGTGGTYSPGWLPYLSQIRVNGGGTAFYPDPTTLGTNPNNNLQIAALRLAATRELMRLELPCRVSDFTSSTSGSPSSAQPVQALLIPQPVNSSGQPLANPGGLSEQYRQFFMTHATSFNFTNESAECLYMIIKFASQNEIGQKNITDDPRLVGDTDGDGMPEIQDAFNAGTFNPPPAGSPYIQHNMPIAFVRWPAGFISDLQPGPTLAQYGNTLSPASSWSYTYEYAAARHDIYDPLRIDPRAFTITPLVFSAGADGVYDIWEHNALPNLFASNDPYFTDNTPASNATPIFPVLPNIQNPNPALQAPLPGAVMDPGTTWPGTILGSGGYGDNITNHLLSTGRQ